MNRSDERKETGAGMARSPGAARRDEESIAHEHVSKEADDEVEPRNEGEDSSMARSRSAAKSGAEGHERYEHRSELGERGTVRGGREIKREHVDADHVMGKGGGVGVSTAEGEPDMASGKANRKEADEPEREEQEKAAMGRERSVAHKNTISWGERETVAKHTI
jgi:hypothetical protein